MSIPTPDETSALTQRAQTLINVGRPGEALAVLFQALARSPENGRALCLLSLAHGKLGQYAEAERWAERAIEARPDNEWGYRLLATHRVSQKRLRAALGPATEAVRLAPELPEAFYTLAWVQWRLQDVRAAAQTTERLRACAPESPLALEMQGILAIKRRDWPNAERFCRAALAKQPESYYALNNLGLALSRLSNPLKPTVAAGGFPEAVECLLLAVQIDPSDALARRNLTRVLARYLVVEPKSLFSVLFLWMLLHIGAAGPGVQAVFSAGLLLFLPITVMFLLFLVLSYRRFQALPDAAREHWRRTKIRYWFETRLILRPFLRPRSG